MLTSWSLVCWLPKGRRFRAEVTIECGIFLGFSVLWGVFPVRDRFLMFSCLLVFSSRSSSFCVLLQVEVNISKFLFRRRTLSWQLLQQNYKGLIGRGHDLRLLERPPKKPRKFWTVKRANHSVCFFIAQLLAGANEKWPCIHLYQISLFSVKQSEIWVRD